MTKKLLISLVALIVIAAVGIAFAKPLTASQKRAVYVKCDRQTASAAGVNKSRKMQMCLQANGYYRR